ncbi:allatostatins [Ceratina calcarata]|uniref:Allatostatins n=1 Tax=Ceratina calcarata TaxID=156304 RepID=A0AAJ7JGY5_9HYME|nr:allatostatins [Ceratina calcarata]XP_017893168.1 allatostatins [Ceratina calcarata]
MMKSRTGLLTSSMALLCVVSIVKSTAAVEETPSSSVNLQHYNSVLMGLDDPVPEKKAYTYVSEYKRLPVYNFGIGKRFYDGGDNKRGREYSFGLGKRTRQYNFGLGKRSDNADYPVLLNFDYPADVPLQENDFFEEKRDRQPYSFGLGKRAVHYSSGQSGKRVSDLSQRYHFGLGKRMLDEEEDSLQ